MCCGWPENPTASGELRITGNSRQRRLQLMGHIGAELLPHICIADDGVMLCPDGLCKWQKLLVNLFFPDMIHICLGDPQERQPAFDADQ